MAGVHVTVTDVTVGAAACTVTVAVPDLVVSSLLVAVTITFPAVDGAVKNPLEVIVPPLADQLTPEL